MTTITSLTGRKPWCKKCFWKLSERKSKNVILAIPSISDKICLKRGWLPALLLLPRASSWGSIFVKANCNVLSSLSTRARALATDEPSQMSASFRAWAGALSARSSWRELLKEQHQVRNPFVRQTNTLSGVSVKVKFFGLLALLFLLPLLGSAQMSGFISSDQITGTALNSSDRSAVVLIHGWNPDGYANKFADGDWPQLVNALHTRLNNTGWKLLLFHWESDANTGPAIDVGIFGITGFANAREAANNAFLNGSRLADLLNQSSPDLRKVVFIAHSAGSWAAYRAADKLLQSNPYVVVNVVLLDPFIPGVDPSIVTSLTTATISQLALHSSTDRIYRLENYYANDATDVDFDWGNGGGRKATSQVFVWRSRDINHRVDYNSTLGFYYDGHGGPIRFFADTVVTTAGPPVPNGLAFAPWDFASVGYYRGLANEGFLLPSIVTHPLAPPPTPQGDTATLHVVANRATSYLWFRNGVSTGVTTPSINLLATSANEGDYVVRVSNSAGQVFSEKAHFSIATASSKPTISSVSPRTFTGRPLPQTQRITVLGTLFSPSSRLSFSDGVSTYPDKVPLSVSSTELKFDIAVGPNAANWTVKVVNGAVESDPFAFSVTSVADTTAPSAPIGLSATRWASGNQFLLDWTNPSDPSGIAKAWVKIGSSPASPTDGVAYLLPANKPLQVTMPLSSGSQSVHLWLEDGSGNRSQNNRATITIGTDVTSPVVLITSPTANPWTTTQSSVVLSGSYGDDLSGVVSVLWQNFPTGSGAATLTSSGLGGTWTTPAITLRPGLNIIAVTATDAAGNVGSRTIQSTYVDASNSSSATVTITPQAAIDQGAQWRINGGPWRNSGFTEQNVPVGPRFVEFINITGGYSTPAGFSINVIAGQNVSASGNYTPIFVAAPPNIPSNPSPAHGAVNVGRAQPRFSWSGAAPGGDLQYAFCIDLANPANPDPPVYFGFGSLNDNSFRFPDTSFALPSATTINWRIKARANGVTVDGPVWRFTTEYAVADLLVKDLALDGNVEPGATVTLNATVVNQGSFVAPLGYLYFYLSRTPGAKEIRLNPLISLIARELLPGNTTNITFSAKLDGLPAGQSFIDAWIDTTAYGPTGEASLENNLTSVRLNYVDGKNPDVSYIGLASAYPKTGVGINIIYTAKDDVGIATVDFYYSTDGGTNWIPIQEGYVPTTPPTYGAGFSWQIPSNAPLSTNLFVRAVARDASGNAGERIAGPYTLRDGTVPTVTILSPNGGEVLDMGSSYQIRWTITASSPLNYATLYFYRNGTTDVLTNVVNLTNGVFLWSVPNNFATTTGKIRIVAEDMNGNNGDDYSDGFFTVRDTTAPPPAPWTTPSAVTSTVGSDPGGTPKIVTDKSGVQHLIYGLTHDGNTHRVSFRYRKRTNGSWGSATLVNLDSQSVDAAVGTDYFIGSWRFAVDNSGNPHLVWTTSFSSFANVNKQEIYYSYFNGSTWVVPVALSSSILGGYNVNSVNWSAKAGLPVATSGAAAAVVNNKLYVIGGNYIVRTYEFDPAANSWTRKADVVGGSVSDGGAAAIGSKIYAIGSQSEGSIKIYDQPTDAWTQGAAIPTRRQGVRLAALNGKIYAVGGYLYSDGTRSAKIEVYDPANNSWSTKTDMPTARGYAALAVVGDKLYVIGGDGNGGGALRTIEIYDPTNDAWSTPVIQAGANWPYSRGGVASVLNGRIYLAGGDTSRTVQEYDPASNTWQPMSLLLSAQQFGCGGAAGSKFYLISGYDESGSAVSAVEEATISSSIVGAVSSSPSVAIDVNDMVHIAWDDGAYYQPDGNEPIGLSYAGVKNIFYTVKTGQSWSTPVQLTTGGTFGPSMVVSRSNDLYVAYSFGMRSIATVKRNGAGWSAPTLVTTNSDGYISLAATTNAFPQIVWSLVSSQPTNQLLYSSFDGAVWSPSEALAATRYAPLPAALTIDSYGKPHVIWEPRDYPAILLYRSKFGGQWTPTIQLNLNSQNVIQSSSDAALSLVNDELHVVWNSSVNGNVEVFYNHASVGSTNDVFAPGVTVPSPATGASLSIGSNINVQWSATDNVGVALVHLHYSTNSGVSWVLIATNQPNSGTFAWTVANLGTSAAQIRVTAQDAANNAGVGFSGGFVTADLTPPSVVIVAPTNGAILSGGTTTNILWTATDNVAIASVDLEYSLNNGVSWSELVTGLNNSGVYAWSVPNIATTVLQIRATVHDTAGLSSSTTVQPLTILRVSAPPVQPNSPFPLNLGTAVSVSPTLQWRSGSPDGGALSYNVRFGTAQNPPVVGTASQTSFSLGALNYLTTYYWQVEATDGVSTNTGPVWSFTTEAITPVSITTQPANQSVSGGQSATFTVSATGTGPLAFQWFFNTTNALLAGATNTSLTLTNVQLTNAGNYTVVVTNAAGSVTSAVAVLTVLVPPTVTADPTNVTANALSDATFSVTAGGTLPLTYQWWKGGVLLGNANGASLTLNAVTTNIAGAYQVVVTNVAGAVTSSVAVLTVNRLVPGLAWATPSAITYGTALGAGQLNATNAVPGNLAYSPTGGVLPVGPRTLTVVFIPADGSVYTTNAANVTLTVNPAPLIIKADNQSRAFGQTNPVLTVSYTGFVNGETPGILMSQPVVATVAAIASPPGSYPITVTGASAANYAVTHTNGILTVTGDAPAITVQPTNAVVILGSNAVFSMTATGTGPLAYQWFFNATNALVSATNTALVLTNVLSSNAGNYSVVVTNLAGSVTSVVAVLTVLVPQSVTMQNFDSGGTAYELAQNNVNPPPTITAGGPTGNFLRLASATAQQNMNTIAFAKSGAGTYNLITAEFDFRITGQADGMCFALLDTFTWGQAGPIDTIGEFYQEPNIVASLGIGFDVFNNVGTGELNDNHVSLHFNGQRLQNFDAGSVNLKSGQWVHAKIIVRPGGGNSDVSVILTPNGGVPVTICTNFVVTGLLPYESRVMFGARTGSLTADHDIDNVNVKFERPVLGTVGFGFATYATPETFPAQVYVSRYGASTGDVTINFATSNLTAIAGVDYVATNGTLTFTATDLVKFFRVEPIDNPTIQSNRQFTVHLINPTGGVTLDTQTVATVTIVDNDDPTRVGAWGTPIDMPANPYPVVPIHANVLPNGKILMWDRGAPVGTAFGGTDGIPYLWDTTAGTFTRTPYQGYDLFSSGHTLMADGRLFVPGGNIADGVGEAKAGIYDPVLNTWTRGPDMNAGRWSPTVTMLGNGDLLVEAGTIDIGTDVNKVSQIWQIANGTWRNLSAAAAQHGVFPVWANYYPFMYLAPNGKVFNAGPQQMARYLDTTDMGAWTDVAASSLLYRDYGTSVMYDDGKIMIHGGNPPEGHTQTSIFATTATIYPSRVTEVINLNDATPAWRQTTPANTGRRHGTAVLLPDGKVFLCNGSSSPGFNIPDGKVPISEVWDPVTEIWTPMAPNIRYRGHNANAFLLPDGRVAATGGGHPSPLDGLAEPSAEIYSPPYLFLGARPTITSSPETVTYRENFTVITPDAASITNVVWIRPGNTTHGFDQNQRIKRLQFSAGNGQLTVTAPSDPNLCPPGHYMLFILNTNGVPAVAKFVRIGMGILAVSKFGSDNLITITTYPGTKYTLERASAMPATTWTTIVANFTAVANTTVIADSGSAGLPARFYRVRQVP